MAMYRSRKSSADPEATAMADAYERAVIDLGITDRSSPQAENIAIAILRLMRDGETDPAQLAQLACRAIATPPATDGSTLQTRGYFLFRSVDEVR